VQILVVVATNQMRTLTTDVDKGFEGTAIAFKLAGPKGMVHPTERCVASTLERERG
jgi:hypothetical protein